MPKKIKDLKRLLQKAGFVLLPKRGKGSHSYWIHELLPKPVVLSGKDGGDAKPYQEKRVAEALETIDQLHREDDK
ncbi:type II toxin-antitoxin system HicA family toxin [Acaryochloris sp. IP29b_bin.148]|uniref:type II toxin-antitoxin system HicA family toxin n=1 Tax=Acaryochloris sp. IP29b_bin.148 TaxID=2969218 RepID=UPI002610325F|nr:type II toxin-antitoxin system HicA family toxin [Acaryochloris sp. IP29b_bin.148]